MDNKKEEKIVGCPVDDISCFLDNIGSNEMDYKNDIDHNYIRKESEFDATKKKML